jgi:hypothetical protein
MHPECIALRRCGCSTSSQRNDWTVYKKKNNSKSGDSHDRTDSLFQAVARSRSLSHIGWRMRECVKQ